MIYRSFELKMTIYNKLPQKQKCVILLGGCLDAEIVSDQS